MLDDVRLVPMLDEQLLELFELVFCLERGARHGGFAAVARHTCRPSPSPSSGATGMAMGMSSNWICPHCRRVWRPESSGNGWLPA